MIIIIVVIIVVVIIVVVIIVIIVIIIVVVIVVIIARPVASPFPRSPNIPRRSLKPSAISTGSARGTATRLEYSRRPTAAQTKESCATTEAVMGFSSPMGSWRSGVRWIRFVRSIMNRTIIFVLFRATSRARLLKGF